MSDLGKVALIGTGAVGCYYGGRLAESGQNVHFLCRSTYAQIRDHGLRVQSCAGDFYLPEVPAYRQGEDIGPVDWVIIAAKATANPTLPAQITPLVGRDTAILTLQNGLGNDTALADHFGAERILGGLCFVCINRLPDGLIHHSASGLIRIGELQGGFSERLSRLVGAFQAAHVPCRAVASLEKAQWMKLVWNFPFNGLAVAEGGVDTHQLLEELGLESEIRALMAEVISCAAALGHDIDPAFIDQQIDLTRQMGAYRPSSLIDYLAGRPVELHALWELPVQRARQLGVAIPHMEALLRRLRVLLVQS